MRDMVRIGPLTPEQRRRISAMALTAGRPNHIVNHEGEYFIPLPIEDFYRVVSVQRKGEALADTLIELLANGIAEF